MTKPIFVSLSPNTERDDILLAFKMILRIILCRTTQNERQNHAEKLEEKFKNYLGVKHAFSFNSGRTAFLAILDSLQGEENSSSEALAKEDEVLIQAFTCNAAVNPIQWSNLKPIFVDIDEKTLNIDPEDLDRKITPKSKVVLVQHTFGLPADLDRILEICQRYNLILIEDCAHSLGAVYKDKALWQAQGKIGTFGKAAFFSFGRDKIISSVYGGMAVTSDDALAQKIRVFREELGYPSKFWIFQQLLHPILTNYLIIPLYSFLGLGRWALSAFQKLKILSKAVHKKEKRGEKPAYIPQKMPNALAVLALHQFEKLERFNKHREKIAHFYEEKLSSGLTYNVRPDVQPEVILPKKQEGRVYMRYSVLLKEHNTDKILKRARKQKIFLDDGWRKTPVMPPDTNQEKMGYVFGSCPKAEEAAKNILNLPTHINISQKEAEKIIKHLNNLITFGRPS